MHQSKIFLISGNAGAGKTTTVRNLAHALKHFGYDVLCADFDLRTPTLGHLFGVPLIQHTVQDALAGRKTLAECIYTAPSGIKLLLSGLAELPVSHPEKIIDTLKGKADIILIDTPTFDQRLHDTKYPTVLVTLADFPSALNCKKLAKKTNAKHVILNNVHNDGTQLAASTISEITNLPSLGIVPHDAELRASQHRGYSILETRPQHPVSEAYKQIAANLLGISYQPSLRKETILTKLGLFI